MPTQEERLLKVEQTITALKVDIEDINHNETILLGLLTQQLHSTREIKSNLAYLTENMNNRFETQQRTIEAVEQHMNSRLDGLEHRFDTLENRFDTLENRFDTLENRFDTLENRFGTLENRFEAQEKRLDEHTVLLTQILARLPEKP